MSSTREDCIHEYCRYGKSELHSVSSFIGNIFYCLITKEINNFLFILLLIMNLFVGGCVSHEIIKLITGQYKPVNNSFVYNAINCSTESFTL